MLFSLITVVALVPLAFAAPPAAAATYCSEDNLLRAFQHTPTQASTYCATITGYPAFLAVTSYPPARLTSGCSCFSRFPVEPTAAPACKANSVFAFQATSQSGYVMNLLLTIDPTVTCGSGNYITNVCGTINNIAIGFTAGATVQGADNCYPLTTAGGFDFTFQGGTFKMYMTSPGNYEIEDSTGFDDGPVAGNFVSTTCTAPCPTPTLTPNK